MHEMIRSLLTALLALCLAAPAVAMPLRGIERVEMTDHQAVPCHDKVGSEMPGKMIAKHDCIGCVAPFLAEPWTEAPEPTGLLPARPPVPVQLAGHSSSPEPPPPRA